MTNPDASVRGFYAALGRGDLDAALALLDEQVKWIEAELSPYYTSELTGAAAILETVLRPVGRDFEGFAASPSDFLSEADRTAAFGLYIGRSRSTGRLLRAPFVHLWSVHAGKLVRFVQYTDSAVWDAAMGGRNAETA